MKKNVPVMTMTLRGSGQAVKLIGTNAGFPLQVKKNRLARHIAGIFASDILLVEVELGDTTRMLLDTSAILVRNFQPQTKEEKWAILEAESATIRVTNMRRHAADETRELTPVEVVRYADDQAYANEMLWLAVTGHMKSDKDRVEFMTGSSYTRWDAPGKIWGTWNTFGS